MNKNAHCIILYDVLQHGYDVLEAGPQGVGLLPAVTHDVKPATFKLFLFHAHVRCQ